jgi:hypothetical protein
MKALFLAATHGLALLIGFGLGVYLLPILTAPPSPDRATLEEMAQAAEFRGELTRNLRGSDFLHWGEGTISLSSAKIVHEGKLAPGPDYKLYLVPEFVEHEDEFLPIRDQAQLIGDIKTFDGFLLDVPAGVNIERFTTALIWCEAFGEFISSTRYR